MRSYMTDSPQAAARVVSLFALSDGNLTREELQGLQSSGLEADLGLEAGEFGSIVRDFCEDLLLAWEGRWTGSSMIEPATFAAILGEVREPSLRRKVLHHALAVMVADGRLSDGESQVLLEVARHWGGEAGGGRG